MEVKADRHDLPPSQKVLEGCTLGQLVERYRASVTPRKKSSDVESHRPARPSSVTRFVENTLSELRTSDFALYRDHRLQKVKPITLKRELTIIHNVFEIARREWGLPIRENPISSLAFKAPDQRRERRLRPGEYERLIEAAASRRNPYVSPIIKFAVETGMRRGEILGIHWHHYDTEQRSLLIPHSKNG